VVLHALTALPPRFDPKSDYLAATNRIREEGTRNLVAAAKAAGAKRVVAESVAFFYEPEGSWVKGEEAPLFRDPPGRFAAACEALLSLESQVLEAGEPEGVILRFGWFYGPGTYYDRGASVADEAMKRRYPVIGSGDGRFSFIHIEDAAAAYVAAVDHGSPGVYNVVDDEPAPLREWLPIYADALGAKPPRRVPAWLARLVAGKDLASTAITMRGASNAKAKRELGWQPAHPSWRQGFADALA
jgi:nucleoside-diphosphate-sugar epimerase